MSTAIEGLLRDLAPQALAAVARRYGDFADAEDAVQEALLSAATSWADQLPDKPLNWLITVASRRLVDHYRQDDARRRREELAASWSLTQPEEVSAQDDTLILMFMCCHDALTPTSAIPLTLRAVGGLTTREIAAAFLVPEATMAQRISRAKATLKHERFALPSAVDRERRLRSVLQVLYLLFNEGYASSSGPDLARADLSGEAIRLTRILYGALPDDGEVAGLLALMLLTDARRPARTGPDGPLIPLSEQDRTCWDRAMIREGLVLLTQGLRRGEPGQYQVLASIAGLHDQAPSHAETRWADIETLYRRLHTLTGNPLVLLNQAVAAAMTAGPDTGLSMLQGLESQLGEHHRLYAVRAHLLELTGRRDEARAAYTAAAARTTNLREQQYLTTRAAALAGT